MKYAIFSNSWKKPTQNDFPGQNETRTTRLSIYYVDQSITVQKRVNQNCHLSPILSQMVMGNKESRDIQHSPRTVRFWKPSVSATHSFKPVEIQLALNGISIEQVTDLPYLKNTVLLDRGTSLEVQSRINKSKWAFAQMRPVWWSSATLKRIKLKNWFRC